MGVADRLRAVRFAAAIATLWVPSLVLCALAASVGASMPPRIAQHWSASGATADASGDAWGLFALALGVAVAAAAVGTWVAARALEGPSAARAMSPFGVVGSAFTVFWSTSVWVTLDAGTPDKAVLGWRIAFLGLALLWGCLPMLLLPATPVLFLIPNGPEASPHPTPWHDTVRSRLMGLLAAAFALVAVALSFLPLVVGGAGSLLFGGAGSLLFGGASSGPDVVAPILFFVVAGLLAEFGRVRVWVDGRGLRVESSRLRIPLMRVALADVGCVRVTELRPLEWGGWGWRWSPSASAYVTGRGTGLVVARRSGRSCAVSLPAAADAAAALRDYVSALGPAAVPPA